MGVASPLRLRMWSLTRATTENTTPYDRVLTSCCRLLTPVLAWTRSPKHGCLNPSTRRRDRARARDWGSRRCTGSSSKIGDISGLPVRQELGLYSKYTFPGHTKLPR